MGNRICNKCYLSIDSPPLSYNKSVHENTYRYIHNISKYRCLYYI